MNTNAVVLSVLMVICGIFWLGPMAAAMYVEDQERKKRGELPPNKALYDERQTIIRLQAGVHALFALGGYLVLWALLNLFGGWAWTGEVAPLVFGGIMLAIVAWTVECALRDAAVGWNQKGGTVPIYALYTTYFFIWGSDLLGSDNIVLGCVMLLSDLGLFTALVAQLYANRRRKKRLEQEEE